MYKLITVAVGIYIVYYVWRAYSNMKNLKKNMDDNPKELLIRYDSQINDLRKQLTEVNETIARNQGFPPSFSVNRGLRKPRSNKKSYCNELHKKKLLEAII